MNQNQRINITNSHMTLNVLANIETYAIYNGAYCPLMRSGCYYGCCSVYYYGYAYYHFTKAGQYNYVGTIASQVWTGCTIHI